ncbi:hypothetical protein N2152v2_003199 [Parachlorella kessleri]
MDFSFIESEGGLQRKSGGNSTLSAAGAVNSGSSGPRPAIAIPSFAEVQRGERAAFPNLFRASVGNAAGSAPPAAPVGPSPLAFLDSRPAPRTRQQPQAQQQQPPGFPSGTPHPRPPLPSPASQAQVQPAHAAGAANGRTYPQQQQQQGLPAARLEPYPPAQRPLQQQQQQQSYQHPGPPQGHPRHQQQQQQQPGGAFPPNAIIVNRRQEQNPVLKYIRNVRWQFGDIVPDYLVGKDAAALFISLRYHLLKPDYIHQRLRELQRSFRLRVVLCHVDTEDAVEPLAQVTRAAIGNECTLICAWSNQECARYLETFKSYENKPAEVIQKDVGTDYVSRINAALTTIRGVNKTDVKTLGDRFGSVGAIFKASAEELQRCPGVGPTKAKRLRETFHEPFRKTIAAAAPPQRALPQQPVQLLPAPQEQEQQHQPQQQQQQQRQDAREAHLQAGPRSSGMPPAQPAQQADQGGRPGEVGHPLQQERQALHDVEANGSAAAGQADRAHETAMGHSGQQELPEQAVAPDSALRSGKAYDGINAGGGGGGALDFDYELEGEEDEDWDIN